MNALKAIIIYLIAIIVCCPCLLIVSEGNTILPNLIGLCYTYMIYRLSFTNVGKRFVKEINKLNNYITKKTMSGYLPAGVCENDPTAPWNQNYKDVIVNVDLTLKATRTIQLVMSEGYSDRDLFDEVSRYVKDMTITDDYNRELTIDDFEIDDYYE